MKPSILYVIGTLGRGGAERQLSYLLSRLRREQYRLAVLTLDGTEEDAYLPELRARGVEVFVGPPHSNRRGKLRTLLRVARQFQPSLIHSYSFYCNALSALTAWRIGACCVGSLRSELTRQQRRSPWLWRLNFAFPRWQIWISQVAIEQAKIGLACSVREELVVIRPGLDLEEWQPLPIPADAVPVIAAIGSLQPVKRWDRLLVAAAQLAEQGIPFQVRLAGEGPLRSQLLQQIQDLRLQRHVVLLGDVKDVASLLACATILVHTSESEGSANVIQEAMACGRPVVATRVGAATYAIRDGVTGIVLPNADDAELAKAVRSLLRQPERLRAMGRAARQDAEALFSLDRVLDETLAVYRRAGWKG